MESDPEPNVDFEDRVYQLPTTKGEMEEMTHSKSKAATRNSPTPNTCDVSISEDSECNADNSHYISTTEEMFFGDEIFGVRTTVFDRYFNSDGNMAQDPASCMKQLPDTDTVNEAKYDNDDDDLSFSLSDFEIDSSISDLSLSAEVEANLEVDEPSQNMANDKLEGERNRAEGKGIIGTLVSYFNRVTGDTEGSANTKSEIPSKVYRSRILDAFCESKKAKTGEFRDIKLLGQGKSRTPHSDDPVKNQQHSNDNVKNQQQKKKVLEIVCKYETDEAVPWPEKATEDTFGASDKRRSRNVEKTTNSYFGASPAKSLVETPMSPVYLISPISSPLRSTLASFHTDDLQEGDSPGVRERIEQYEEYSRRSSSLSTEYRTDRGSVSPAAKMCLNFHDSLDGVEGDTDAIDSNDISVSDGAYSTGLRGRKADMIQHGEKQCNGVSGMENSDDLPQAAAKWSSFQPEIHCASEPSERKSARSDVTNVKEFLGSAECLKPFKVAPTGSNEPNARLKKKSPTKNHRDHARSKNYGSMVVQKIQQLHKRALEVTGICGGKAGAQSNAKDISKSPTHCAKKGKAFASIADNKNSCSRSKPKVEKFHFDEHNVLVKRT